MDQCEAKNNVYVYTFLLEGGGEELSVRCRADAAPHTEQTVLSSTTRVFTCHMHMLVCNFWVEPETVVKVFDLTRL